MDAIKQKTQEITFTRENTNEKAWLDFRDTEIDINNLYEYFDSVERNEVLLFGFFEGEKRLGSGLYQIKKDTLLCLEIAGKKLPIENFLFGFSIGLAKNFNCTKFNIGTNRLGLKKIALKRGFKQVYTEYEIKV